MIAFSYSVGAHERTLVFHRIDERLISIFISGLSAISMTESVQTFSVILNCTEKVRHIMMQVQLDKIRIQVRCLQHSLVTIVELFSHSLVVQEFAQHIECRY